MILSHIATEHKILYCKVSNKSTGKEEETIIHNHFVRGGRIPIDLPYHS